ncbi:hypothetical protein M3J09_004121 [Ascochyta lentis]
MHPRVHNIDTTSYERHSTAQMTRNGPAATPQPLQSRTLDRVCTAETSLRVRAFYCLRTETLPHIITCARSTFTAAITPSKLADTWSWREVRLIVNRYLKTLHHGPTARKNRVRIS